jgi:8-oxo-dGTP pyrophosphatase MutT (NUDIX family)
MFGLEDRKMRRIYRISAGAIVLKKEKVLLIRYNDRNGSTFLEGPGGGVRMREDLPKAAIREVKEETGLDVNPYPCRVLFIEELLSYHYRYVRIWLLCGLVGGKLTRTQGAKKERIVEAGWYSQGELAHEVVYPPILSTTDWQAFLKVTWEPRYLGLRKAGF